MNKLNDPKTAPKTYQKIIKTIVNGTKISLIPPLVVGNQLVTDFLAKAGLLHDCLSKQCTAIGNSSSIPAKYNFRSRGKIFYF